LCVLAAAAALHAQQAPRTPRSSAKPPATRSAQATTGSSTYRNLTFGFAYKIPFGWVDRTDVMQPDANNPSGGQVLLAVFERPPEVGGDTVNSAVVLATEKASAYPGLKTAADYFGPLGEVVTAKGFKGVNEPYEFSISTKLLLREDFTQGEGKAERHQSSLVLLEKGQIVCFTFIGGTADEVDELVERLSFGPRPSPAGHK